MVDPALLRPAEVDLLLGDPTKARDASSAGSRRSRFEGLVEMMVDADMQRVSLQVGFERAGE